MVKFINFILDIFNWVQDWSKIWSKNDPLKSCKKLVKYDVKKQLLKYNNCEKRFQILIVFNTKTYPYYPDQHFVSMVA